MIQLPPIPYRVAALPRDERGYPVPWFVAWIDGKPEFRCADASKYGRAVTERRCWVCGETLGVNKVFVIGPMCLVNRTTSEPPCHLDCAEFSAKACPFLSKPKAQRREAHMPADCGDAPGFAIDRNPGCTVLYVTKGFSLIRVRRNPSMPELQEGFLFRLGDPAAVHFYREGRAATRAEVLESIDSGMPLLRDVAKLEGYEAIDELEEQYQLVTKLLPTE